MRGLQYGEFDQIALDHHEEESRGDGQRVARWHSA